MSPQQVHVQDFPVSRFQLFMRANVGVLYNWEYCPKCQAIAPDNILERLDSNICLKTWSLLHFNYSSWVNQLSRICRSIQSRYFSVKLYTPYFPGRPHPWPQLLIPPTNHFSWEFWHIRGPPPSPWHLSLPPSSNPAQTIPSFTRPA